MSTGGTGTIGDIEYRRNGNNKGKLLQEEREQQGIWGTRETGTAGIEYRKNGNVGSWTKSHK